MKTKNRLVVVYGLGGQRDIVKEYQVSFGGDKNILKLENIIKSTKFYISKV